MAETEQKEEKMKKELEKVYDPKQELRTRPIGFGWKNAIFMQNRTLRKNPIPL